MDSIDDVHYGCVCRQREKRRRNFVLYLPVEVHVLIKWKIIVQEISLLIFLKPYLAALNERFASTMDQVWN